MLTTLTIVKRLPEAVFVAHLTLHLCLGLTEAQINKAESLPCFPLGQIHAV